MKPVIFIVTMFSVIFTFSDFQLIYVLTHGGPANATQVFATYAFDIAMGARPARPGCRRSRSPWCRRWRC